MKYEALYGPYGAASLVYGPDFITLEWMLQMLSLERWSEVT
jgi:hypothetical protein